MCVCKIVSPFTPVVCLFKQSYFCRHVFVLFWNMKQIRVKKKVLIITEEDIQVILEQEKLGGDSLSKHAHSHCDHTIYTSKWMTWSLLFI